MAATMAVAAALLNGCDTDRLRALEEAERQRAIRNEAGFLAQKEAELRQEELAKGWSQLRPGMTAEELGRTFPLNFPTAVRNAIQSKPAHSMTLNGHKLRFRQGVLEAIQ